MPSTQETLIPAFTDPPATHLVGIPTANLTLASPSISYGLSFPEACKKHIDTRGASRVYIIASGTLARTSDALERLIKAIGEDRVVGTRKGMTPHTLWSEIVEVVNEAREARTDCLVTLGAGSLTDGAKIIALALANDISTSSDLENYSIVAPNPPSEVNPPNVPLICIPTSLSGGEYFSLAGGTDDRASVHNKLGFLHSGMGPELIILDPELCLSTPAYHWLSTGVRGVDHCVEAFCSLESTKESDEKAEKGLRLLVPNLLKCKNDRNDVEARLQCQMAVRYGMNNVRAGIPMGGSHAIGHVLGPEGVPHGVTSCIMLPAVMKYNIKHGGDKKSEIESRQKKVRDILWSEPEVEKLLTKKGFNQDTADLGDVLDVFIRALDLPRSLKEVNVDKAKIPHLAEVALKDFWAPTNPVPLVEKEQTLEILEDVA